MTVVWSCESPGMLFSFLKACLMSARVFKGSLGMADGLLPTTVVGSYPQPDWLVDRARLKTMVPRVRVHELWRVAEPYLAQAQDDATMLAIRDMERAGIDIISDGE